jgi:hypothetical protein
MKAARDDEVGKQGRLCCVPHRTLQASTPFHHLQKLCSAKLRDNPMRHLLTLATLITSSMLLTVSVYAGEGVAELKSAKYFLGPVTVGYDERLKICTTDTSSMDGSVRGAQYPESDIALITHITVFDSVKGGQIDIGDYSEIVFSGSRGICTTIEGRHITDGTSNTVFFAVTATTESAVAFNPLVSGQLIAPNNTSGISLLIPAVQAARETH